MNIVKYFPKEIRMLKYIYRRINNNFKYKGNNVYCPCCQNYFSSFMPYPESHNRQNAICPNCFSGERHRLLMLFLQNKTNIFNDEHHRLLLHTAPERCFFNIFKKINKLEYYPVDKFPDNYPKGVKKMDITKIDYPDKYFDIILSNHVLEHINQDRNAIKELHRVLKSAGWAIIQVPIDYSMNKTYENVSITNPIQRKEIFGHPDHKRIYGNDYVDRLLEAGFLVKIHDYYNQFNLAERKKFGLGIREKIFLCTKN